MKDIENYAFKDGYLCVQTFCTGEEVYLVSPVTKEQLAAALEVLGCGAQLEDISMEHSIEIKLQTREQYRASLVAGEVFGHGLSLPLAAAIIDDVNVSTEHREIMQDMDDDLEVIKFLKEKYGYNYMTAN